jgi:hypothetical protein
MMSLGVAVLLLIVIVLVATAPAGVVVGLLGPADELELLLDPHAMIAPAAAAAHANTRNRLVIVCIPQLDLKTSDVAQTFRSAMFCAGLKACATSVRTRPEVGRRIDAAEHRRWMNGAVVAAA